MKKDEKKSEKKWEKVTDFFLYIFYCQSVLAFFKKKFFFSLFSLNIFFLLFSLKKILHLTFSLHNSHKFTKNVAQSLQPHNYVEQWKHFRWSFLCEWKKMILINMKIFSVFDFWRKWKLGFFVMKEICAEWPR